MDRLANLELRRRKQFNNHHQRQRLFKPHYLSRTAAENYSHSFRKYENARIFYSYNGDLECVIELSVSHKLVNVFRDRIEAIE